MTRLDEPCANALPLREFLCHAMEHRSPALWTFGAILSIALLIAALLPPHYRATATLAVLPSPEFTVRPAAGSHELNASALAMDQIMKAETEILGSDDLHADTLRDLGPANLYPEIFAPSRGVLAGALHRLAALLLSPWRAVSTDTASRRLQTGLERFRKDLDVLPAKDSNVITLTFDSTEAPLAAAALNSLLRLYAARRSKLYDDPQMEVVRRQAETAGGRVAEADRQLAAFKRGLGISDLDQQRGLLLRWRSQTDQAVAEATISSAENRARLETLNRQIAAEPTTVGLFKEQDNDTRLQAVNDGLQDLRARQAAEGLKYRDDSRMMTMLRAQIASHEAEATRLRHDPSVSVLRQGRNPSLDPLRLDRARAGVDWAAAQARLAAEQKQARSIAEALSALDADEASLAELQRSKSSAEEDFRTASRILAERSLSEAEDARRLANVRIIQPALVPQTPRPWPALVFAGGLLFGTVAALARITGRFVLREAFLTGEGLQAATDLPVLAVFPRYRRDLAETSPLD